MFNNTSNTSNTSNTLNASNTSNTLNYRSSIKIIKSPTSIKEIVFNNGICEPSHPLYTYRNQTSQSIKSKQIEKNVKTYKMSPLRTSKSVKEDVDIQLNTTNGQINTQKIKIAISYDNEFYYVKNKITNEVYQIDKSDIKKICKENNSLLSDKLLYDYIKKL